MASWRRSSLMDCGRSPAACVRLLDEAGWEAVSVAAAARSGGASASVAGAGEAMAAAAPSREAAEIDLAASGPGAC